MVRSILPPGPTEDPHSPFRFSGYADWARGVLHPAPLSRVAVDGILASRRDLAGESARPVQEAQRAAPVRSSIDHQPLPGQAPEDPVLEAGIRYLNRKERTHEEIVVKLQELREYVEGNGDRTRELVAGLTRFLYVMRESQTGKMRIVYGTLETLKLVSRFYDELVTE